MNKIALAHLMSISRIHWQKESALYMKYGINTSKYSDDEVSRYMGISRRTYPKVLHNIKKQLCETLKELNAGLDPKIYGKALAKEISKNNNIINKPYYDFKKINIYI